MNEQIITVEEVHDSSDSDCVVVAVCEEDGVQPSTDHASSARAVGRSAEEEMRALFPNVPLPNLLRALEGAAWDLDSAVLNIESKYDIETGGYWENTPQKTRKPAARKAMTCSNELETGNSTRTSDREFSPTATGLSTSSTGKANLVPRRGQNRSSRARGNTTTPIETTLDPSPRTGEGRGAPPKNRLSKQQAAVVSRRRATGEETVKASSPIMVFSERSEEKLVSACLDLKVEFISPKRHNQFDKLVLWDSETSESGKVQDKNCVLCLDGSDITNHIKNCTLVNLIADLRASFPMKRITIVLYGVDSFCKKALNQNSAGAGIDSEPVVSLDAVSDSRTWLLVEKGISTHCAQDLKACAKFLVHFTECLQEEPKRLRPSCLLDATTRTKKKAVRDADHESDGALLTTTYQGMLIQIPGLSWDSANAIARRFPSIASLASALATQGPETVTDYLKEIDVQSRDGSRKRKLGPVLAEKVVKVFTCSEPEIAFVPSKS
ncbi:hypothetical protein NDN08_000094 [Rhodosorus marinus]|uniref:CUE domain-containing protein n=1 Tax=Rhodosorus marinus TaxID=101924 RepID=A0AAV8UEB1_9RHOD|nr:hypothetical protein NDN08_000094 [Rhodosorus marinus]